MTQDNYTPSPLDIAEAIKTLCAVGTLPDDFEDVADWVAAGKVPEKNADRWLAQHHRDSVELRRLCAARDDLKKQLADMRSDLTPRDKFAMAALQGYLSGFVHTQKTSISPEMQDAVAEGMYSMADAMLKARKGGAQ